MESESFLSGIAWRSPCSSPVEEEMSSPGFRQTQEPKDMRLSRGPTTCTLSSTESTSSCSDMEDSSSPDILGRPTGTDTASTARTDWHVSSSRDSTNTAAPMSRRKSSRSISCISDGDELGNCTSERGTNPTARPLMESTTASTTHAVARTGPPAPQAGASRAPSSPPGYSSSSSDDFSLFVGEYDSSSPDIPGRPTGTDTASTARTDWHVSSSRDSTNTVAPMGRRRSSSGISSISNGDELGNCTSERGPNPTARSLMESTTASTRQAVGRTGTPAPQDGASRAPSSPPGYSSSPSGDFSLLVGEHDKRRRRNGKGKERRLGALPVSSTSRSPPPPASRRSTLPLSPSRRDDERQGVQAVESDTAEKALLQARRAWARTSGRTSSSSSSSSSPFPSSSSSSSLFSPKASSLSTAEKEAEMLFSASIVDLSTTSPGKVEMEPVREVIDIVDDGPPLLSASPSSRKREREKTGGRQGGAGDSGGGGVSGRNGSEDEHVIEASSPRDGEDIVFFGAPANTGRGRTVRASGVGRTHARRSGAAGQSSRGSSHDPALEESEDENITIGSSRRQRRRLPNGVQSLVTNSTGGSTRSSGNGDDRVGSRIVNGRSTRGVLAARQRRQTDSRTDRLAARLQREETVQQEERDAEMARRLQSEEINVADWGEGNTAGVVAAAAAARAAAAAVAVRTAAAAAASSSQHVRRGPNRSEGGSIGHGNFRLNASRVVPSARPRRVSGSGSGGRSTVEWDIAAIMNLVTETLSDFSGGGSNGGSSSSMSLMNRDLTPADYQELLSLDEHNSGCNHVKGLSAAEMSMLPHQTGNGSGPVQQCCICMEDMTSRQKITRLPACLHTFHSKCISKWLKGQATCPIDKVVVNVRDE